MDVVKLAWRNTRRRPARSALLATSVALALTMALALLSLSNGIEIGVRDSVEERGADLIVAQRNAVDNFSGFLPENIEGRLRAVAGVGGVAGELAMFAPVDEDRQLVAVGWAPQSYFWPEAPLSRGRTPRPHEREAVLGEGAAAALGKTVGDTIRVFDEELAIVGVAAYRSAVNRGILVLPLATLQELAFRQGQVTVFHIRLADDASVAGSEAVATAIEALGGVTVLPSDDLLARDRNYRILRAISFAISLIALSIAGLGILNALLTAVQERTREIGIMMAIGWSRPRIVGTVVAEGALVGLAGCTAGIPLGLAACVVLNRLPVIGDVISFVPSTGLVALCAAAAMALAVIGALYPGWRAVSQPPAQALRRV